MSDVDCPWTGTLSGILLHIKTEHDSKIADVSGHFNLQLQDFERERFYSQLVLSLGEFFCLVWNTEHEDLVFTVLHLGPKADSGAFKYGIKISNSEEYVAGSRKCQSYLDVVPTDLHHWDCVAIKYNTLLYFISENGCLSCEIEIGREKLDGFVLREQEDYLPVVSVQSLPLWRWKGRQGHVTPTNMLARSVELVPNWFSRNFLDNDDDDYDDSLFV
jgi:hypothetical protein